MKQFTKFLKYGIPGINKQFLLNFKNDVYLKKAIQNSIPYLSKQSINSQQNIMNFYNSNTIVPYTSISANGPWIIASNGAVLYDVGGYGMLGFGHSPDWALQILSKPHVMANIMTPNKIQYKFTSLLQNTIGQNREGKCPYNYFSFLNSGSESIELSTRILDTMNKKYNNNNKQNVTIVLKNSFHGRTTKAASLSNSTLNTYINNLQSYQSKNNIQTIEINNSQLFKNTFNELKKKYNIDAVFMEPVMGEGNPGIQITPEFYSVVRELTKKNNTALVIDSIQAGIRTTGYLSIVDYPELNVFDPPDMEIFSKAISAGQFPLSILAITKNMYNNFKIGTYGNTMTGNPKALEIGYETIKRIDQNIIKNIQIKGKTFKQMLDSLHEKYPTIVTNVTGTGLLLALHINKKYIVDDYKGLEYICRKNGLNVIHGGENALRFTPYFKISNKEIDLIYSILDQSLFELSN